MSSRRVKDFRYLWLRLPGLAMLLVSGSMPLSAGVNAWTPLGPEGGHLCTVVAAPSNDSWSPSAGVNPLTLVMATMPSSVAAIQRLTG